jgi:hypothetical protein
MLNIILLGGEKDKNWSEAAVEKIINSINSCQSLKQLMTCRALVNNYLFAAIIAGHEADDDNLRLVSSLLHFLVKSKENQLIKEMDLIS